MNQMLNNKSIFRFIDQVMIEKLRVIIERSNWITYILALIFVWSLDNEYIVYSITS